MATNSALSELLKERDALIKSTKVDGAKPAIRIQLNKKTVKQLQEICKEMKIYAYGRKVEIIANIINTLFQENKENQNAPNLPATTIPSDPENDAPQSPPKSTLYIISNTHYIEQPAEPLDTNNEDELTSTMSNLSIRKHT